MSLLARLAHLFAASPAVPESPEIAVATELPDHVAGQVKQALQMQESAGRATRKVCLRSDEASRTMRTALDEMVEVMARGRDEPNPEK